MIPNRGKKACGCDNCKAVKTANDIINTSRRVETVRNLFVFTEDMEARYQALDKRAARIAAEFTQASILAAFAGGEKKLTDELVRRTDQTAADALKFAAEVLKFAAEVEAYAARPEVKATGEQRVRRFTEMQLTGRAIMVRHDRLLMDRDKVPPAIMADLQAACDAVNKSAEALIGMGAWDSALMDWHERDAKRVSDVLAAAGY